MPWIKKGSSGSTSSSLKQVSLSGIAGSTSTPYEKDITIPSTTDFNRSSVEVLKFVQSTNQIVTENTFSNGESADFVSNPDVILDGKMHLRTSINNEPMTNDGSLGSNDLWEYSIDISKYNAIDNMTVSGV